MLIQDIETIYFCQKENASKVLCVSYSGNPLLRAQLTFYHTKQVILRNKYLSICDNCIVSCVFLYVP